MISFCLLGLSLLALGSVSRAATFAVSNTNDAGSGSLRQAITDALAAGAGTHVINAGGVTGTISLQTALPTITNTTLTINGPTSGTLTITRGVSTQFRIFTVNNSSGAVNLTLNHLTMTNGSAVTGDGGGGGIYAVSATLTLNFCTISGCTATAAAPSTLEGGGIYVTGLNSTFNANYCTFSGNQTNRGGGLNIGTGNSSGTATLRNCTISGNTSLGGAGALQNALMSTTLRNCTLSGNTAATGGGAIVGGDWTMINCTVTGNTGDTTNTGGNGGAMRVSSTLPVTIINSLIVGNFAGNPAVANDITWTSTTYSNKTIRNSVVGVMATGMAFNTTTASQTGTAASPKVVNLGALANNGGVTKTHALQASSPELAINLGSNADASAFPFDQRGVGYNRFNGTVDIGAYETGVTAPNFTGVAVLGAPAQVNNASSLTFTVPPGDNRLLVVTASNSINGGSATITGVSFGGTAMTEAVKKSDGVAVDGIWVLALGSATTATTGTISVTSSPATPTAIGAVVFQNVNQTTPTSGAQSASGAGASSASTLTVTSAVGDAVFDLFDIYDSSSTGTQTPASGQAVVHNIDAPSGSLYAFYQSSVKPGATSTAMTWSSSGQSYIHAAINLKQAVSNTAPTISDVANQTISQGASTSALAFTVGDAETAAASLTVTATSSNTTLVPNANIALGGSGASRTVTVAPVTSQSGTATITLTVTDGGGMTATDTFVVTVTADSTAPTIVSIVRQSPASQTIGDGTTSFTFRVTYSEAVTGVTTSSFEVEPRNGSTIAGSVTNVTGSGATRDVTVTLTGGHGEFRLKAVD